MAAKRTPIPRVTSQPPSVDFIQNHLPFYHKAFENQNCRYDPVSQRFIPIPEAVKMTGSHPLPGSSGGKGLQSPSVRRPTPAVAAMGFWDKILPESMTRLAHEKKVEPKEVQKRKLSLRGKGSWNEVYLLLQIAREHYDATKGGFWGKCQKGTCRAYRGASKHTGVARQAWKLVPDHVVVSPVKAAVEVLLDAVEVAADARGKITSTFDDGSLEKTFEDIEIFLTTFQGDQNIVEASIKLITVTLSAVEDAMDFFLSHKVKRIFDSLVQAKNYQKPLLEGIGEIQKKSNDLIREAERSELVGSRDAMERIIQSMRQVVYLEFQQGEKLEYMSDQVDAVGLGMTQMRSALGSFEADLMGKVNALLMDGAKSRETYTKKIEALESKIEALQLEQHNTDARTKPSNHSSQDESLGPNHHPPQQWPPTALPAPWAWGYYYPPTLFVPPPRYPFPITQPQQTDHTPTIDTLVLRRLLDIPDLDSPDIDSILESSDAIPLAYRSRAKQIIGTTEFRDWATSAKSRLLFVQGDPMHDMSQSPSALSLVCTTLTKGLRAREQFVSLAFFCGHHTEPDEHPGGGAMIRSLIAQLLQQYFPAFSFPTGDVDVEAIKEGDIEALCGLFGCLVRRLPARMILVCVLDGVGCYENDEHEHDLLQVVKFLVGLRKDDSVAPAIKILVTSEIQSDKVHELLEDEKSDEDEIDLLVEGLDPIGHGMDLLDTEDASGMQ
ncbi:uncharacterized protein BKCO1_8800020 [Diplodia corticola]|uniref:Nephrocystin 3-like N-terminal domain-containing protein n=1 Tax=Diplodia corticola TaxID=236234 RepID=A0A1J9RMR7_9PEZI|nr:uncharacterized protein BKCO1_8800020 [Diplodia corticola]OJD29212.1 hypothetical protein BKCO1_8800020 [Diplodia corticola]